MRIPGGRSVWSTQADPSVSLEQLVKFTGESVRLPPTVMELLARLHSSKNLLGRVTVRGGHEGEQQTADLYLALFRDPYARYYGTRNDHDDLYEALEGAGTERLLIRAYIREVDGPSMRFLAFDASELRPTDDLAMDSYTDEEHAWLLTTEKGRFGEHAEELHEALDAWNGEKGERPKLQNLKLIHGQSVLDLQAIEMPLDCTLREARAFAERLKDVMGTSPTVHSAPRQDKQRRGVSSEYESVSRMAQRLRRK